jgi:hypothetical protein
MSGDWNWDWGEFGEAVLLGALGGALLGGGIGAVGRVITNRLGGSLVSNTKTRFAARFWSATTKDGVHVSPYQNMMRHLKDHGKNFRPEYKTAVEFTKGARQTIKIGTYLPSRNAYISFNRISRKDKKELYNIVGLNRSNGKIVTFHTQDIKRIMK